MVHQVSLRVHEHLSPELQIQKKQNTVINNSSHVGNKVDV